MREWHKRLLALKVCEPAADESASKEVRPASNRDSFLINILLIQSVGYGFRRLAVAG